MSTEANLQAVKRTIDAVNQRDFAVLGEVLSSDFKRHDLAAALPGYEGSEAAVNIVEVLLRAMPDLLIELQRLLSNEDSVAAHVTIRTRTKESFWGSRQPESTSSSMQ